VTGEIREIPVAPAGQRGSEPPAAEVLLDIRDLRTYFKVMDGTVRAVDGVSISVPRGGTLGLVGESACGKSVTALTIMRLLDIPPAEIASGEVWFDGQELVSLPEDEMRKIRGNDIAMVFQEPLTSLNPVLTIGEQISEQIRVHLEVSKKEAWERVIAALELVGIPSAAQRAKQYPHEMSGGMRQRVMIAMALSCEPKLLIADEPTTALDVTIQAQILELLKAVRDRTNSALLLITHDLGVVAETVDRVVVMYAGQIVEEGTTTDVLTRPTHPYTVGLLSSLPSGRTRGTRLSAIKGVVPSPFNLPPGCRFAPRCRFAWDDCRTDVPELVPSSTHGQRSRCLLHLPGNEARREAAFGLPGARGQAVPAESAGAQGQAVTTEHDHE
jgi:oligopeptide/dipeptide ABC transporter ATP-binding protein